MAQIIEWSTSPTCQEGENTYQNSSETYKKKDKWEDVTVDLIAAGYEWICPNCDKNNSEIEITEKVQCNECQLELKVADYDHAFEKQTLNSENRELDS